MAKEQMLDTVDYWPAQTAQKESIPATAGRELYRTARNAAVTVLGAPSDIAEGSLNLLNAGIELLPGVQESPLPKHLPLPTSEWIEKNVAEPIEKKILPPGYGEAQNAPEDIWDTTWKDFVGLMSGGRVLKAAAGGLKAAGALAKGVKGGAALAQGAAGLSKAAQSIPFAKSFTKLAKFLNPEKITVGKAATLSGLGNLASYGSKYLGAEPGTQAGLKVGTMLIASLGGPNAVANEIKDKYKILDEIKPPKGSTIPAKELFADLHQLQVSEVNQGFNQEVIPAKGFLDKALANVRSKIDYRTNTIPVDEAWKMKKEMNKVIFESHTRADSTKIKYAEDVRDALNKSLKGPEAAEKYPEFVKGLTETDKMMTGYKGVSEVSHFLVGHNIMKDLQNPLTKAMFYSNLSGGLMHIGTLIGTVGTLKNTIVPMEMFIRSPEIRSYYYKAMKAAYAKNALVANRYIKKFDKKATEMYPGFSEGSDTVE